MKNLKINKRRLLSLLVASGISLLNISNAEIFSYNHEVYLKDGDTAKLYFSKRINDMNYAYISSGNMVGFIYEDEVNLGNITTNNYFVEDNDSISVITDVAYVYQTPDINNQKIVGILNKNDVVDIMARTNDGWYVVYINGISGFMHESSFIEKSEDTITMAKITGNNVNVRYSPSTKQDNIIGFADISDNFKIIGQENDWYIIDYLGKTGYISNKYVKEIEVNKNDIEVQRMAYLRQDSFFCTELNTNNGITLPAYQNVGVIGEMGDYYKVKIDGVIGYISKNNVKRLTSTCVVIDLSRQILKVFKNGLEVFRAHIITGRQSLQTQIGCFKIGHMVMGYQLTPDNYVDYWIQYDDNRGIHDASWQKDKYFSDVAHSAYENYFSGRGMTYPHKHGSHGCSNMQLADVIDVYNLVHVGDNVLVIGPNNLVRNHLVSKISDYVNNDNVKVKKLV